MPEETQGDNRHEETTPQSADASSADGAEGQQSSAAEALANEALAAAEQAVAGLKGDSEGGGSPAEAINAAQSAVEGLGDSADGTPPEMPPLEMHVGGVAAAGGIDLLSDVNLTVKIELGRTRMLLEDVLRLSNGSVVELDKLAGDPVDVFVNDRHVARGEVLILNDNFCVRINDILVGAGRAVSGDKEKAAG